MKRSPPWLALGGIVAVFLTACGGEASKPAGEVVTGASTSVGAPVRHVALGDSYAAMRSRHTPLLGEPFCLRSADNYPALVSEDVIDVSCQGAITDDLLEPRYAGADFLPAQLDALGALDAKPTLVTVSIGGNDLGFGEVSSCIRQRMDTGQGSDCVELLNEKTRDRVDQVPGKLDVVHREIHHRAGNAQVVVTGYLPLLVRGECPELANVSETDRQWAANLTGEINQIVQDAAERNGAVFVLPEDAVQHTSCAEPADRWVDIRGVDTDAYPMHLTSAGHEAMAKAVHGAVRGAAN